MVFAFGSLLVRPHRLPRPGIVVAHSTILKFHRALVQRKYRLLLDGSKRRGKPGPKGPCKELVDLIVGIKTRNPRYGCPKIALLAANVLKTAISEDLVRRILKKHYRPLPGDGQ